VPVEREERTALLETTGSDLIPALVAAGGSALVGEDAISAYLDGEFEDPPGAEAHRLKAAKARRRHLEEECGCLQPATR